MIRICDGRDFELIWAIINEAASVYKGVIPEDRWTDPYMSKEELRHEIGEGVAFWGYEESGTLAGVMGIQNVKDVTLIRHAYVRSGRQGSGIGGRLLSYLRGIAKAPLLIGTWATASWAIRFYETHGFQIVSPSERDVLLRKYWTIPERQIETSVVLASHEWRDAQRA